MENIIAVARIFPDRLNWPPQTVISFLGRLIVLPHNYFFSIYYT